MTNEEKAKEIVKNTSYLPNLTEYEAMTFVAMEMAKWKDKQIKKKLVDFMQYLNKRDFFHDDLCFDIEHQVETFIELQNRNKTK